MKLSPINSQTFKGFLIIPASERVYANGQKVSSPKLEVETDDIVEIDNNHCCETRILYNKNNDLAEYIYYHNGSTEKKNKILLGYIAAATQKNIIIDA